MTNAAEGGKVWTPDQNIAAPIPPRAPSKVFWISLGVTSLGMLMMISLYLLADPAIMPQWAAWTIFGTGVALGIGSLTVTAVTKLAPIRRNWSMWFWFLVFGPLIAYTIITSYQPQ